MQPGGSDTLLRAWRVDAGLDPRLYIAAAHEKALGEPPFRLLLVAAHGDSLTVQVVEGLMSPEPNTFFYVQARGVFRVARRERWSVGRELLLLEASPKR